MLETVEIPYGGYWSTPFAKWQGEFADLHSVRFAAHVAKRELAKRGIDGDVFDHAVLGVTIPQWRSFWGAPWLMQMIGIDGVPGPTVVQACQTGPRALISAALEVNAGTAETSLVVTCDRTSNGAFVHYPGDGGWGGVPETEAWVVDNFMAAPETGDPVLRSAENVARQWQIATEEQHEVAARRFEQYADALADSRAFHARFMTLPFEVPDARFRKTTASIDGDRGVAAGDKATMARLEPVLAEGTVTLAGQTHPADGNASIIVTTPGRSLELARDDRVRITIAGFAQARAEIGYMPAAPVAAAWRALQRAGLTVDDLTAVKTHNPFVVNDIVFARETGFDAMAMNNFGSSLVFGHPQGPTGTRLMIELIEELVLVGGGYGLYHGCAAGDSGFAVVFRVTDRQREAA